jgi:hypothetical protein
MCLIKTPKVAASTTSSQADAAVLRNPFLDGVDPSIAARTTGLSSLRIDRGSVKSTAPTPAQTVIAAQTPTASNVSGASPALPRITNPRLSGALGLRRQSPNPQSIM